MAALLHDFLRRAPPHGTLITAGTAFELGNEAALRPEELELQHKRHDFIQMQRGSLEKAHLEGKQEGRTEGRVEGEQTKALEIAKKLLSHMSDAEISQITNLLLEQIHALRNVS
jgi:predicted transposase/invertase (TIGR01784 family)